MSADDRSTLEAWARGDRAAGDAFIRSYFPLLWRYFANKIDADVEDAIQTTLLACIEHRHRLEQARSVRAYVLTIARHELYARGRIRAAFEPVGSSIAGADASPSSIAHQRHLADRLRVAIRSLPPILQETVELYVWAELRGAELAGALGVPEGTMRSRLRRARALLSTQLGVDMPNIEER